MISRIRRFLWVFTMMHKIAFTLSLEMLKRKGVQFSEAYTLEDFYDIHL